MHKGKKKSKYVLSCTCSFASLYIGKKSKEGRAGFLIFGLAKTQGCCLILVYFHTCQVSQQSFR